MFQTGSLTGALFSQSDICRVCPGFCVQPLSLLLPTFAALSGLVVIAVILEIIKVCDAGRNRNIHNTERSFRDFLLSSVDTPSRDSVSRVPASKCLRISAFCIRFLRGVTEACSSYMLLPTVFVFVVNVWPTSFAQASTLQRVIIIAMPVIALLLRVFVIRRLFVEMSHNDQVVLYVQSIINCSVSVVLGVYFIKDRDWRQENASFMPNMAPQYFVLALFSIQLILQTIIRRKSTEPSLLDDIKWPCWPAHHAFASSSGYTTVSNTGSGAAFVLSTVEFVILNHLTLSQMAIVITGLASVELSGYRKNDATVAMGVIPLVSSGFLLLTSAIKVFKFMFRVAKQRFGNRSNFSNHVRMSSPQSRL